MNFKKAIAPVAASAVALGIAGGFAFANTLNQPAEPTKERVEIVQPAAATVEPAPTETATPTATATATATKTATVKPAPAKTTTAPKKTTRKATTLTSSNDSTQIQAPDPAPQPAAEPAPSSTPTPFGTLDNGLPAPPPVLWGPEGRPTSTP